MKEEFFKVVKPQEVFGHQRGLKPVETETVLLSVSRGRILGENIIASTGPFYTNYKFVPQRSSVEMFKDYSREKANFLKSVFSCARKGRKWFSLDIDEVIAKTGAERKRVVTALNYLEEQGELVLQVAGARRGYRIIRRLSEPELEELGDRLVERFSSREENDIKRINQVVSLINHPDCQTNFLLDYFGEHRDENCNHCEFCLNLTSSEDRSVKNELCAARAVFNWQTWKAQIEKVLAENHAALQSPRQQARFFCGIRSPQSSKAGLARHPAFGLLAGLPFVEVFERLSADVDA